MVFDQTIYVGNTAAEKIYVRTTYEKWQQLKFSTEVKLLSGGVAGGGVNFEQARDFTEGFTALAPHHTLKMIGSFFSAEADLPPPTDDEPTVEKRQSISRNYRVPNKHSIIVTPQHTVQVVRSGDRWKKQCMETCVFMIRAKPTRSLWQRITRKTEAVSHQKACKICKRGGKGKSEQES